MLFVQHILLKNQKYDKISEIDENYRLSEIISISLNIMSALIILSPITLNTLLISKLNLNIFLKNENLTTKIIVGVMSTTY